jgi:hypothetical protein
MEKVVVILVVLAIILVPLGIAANHIGQGIEYATWSRAHQRALDQAQAREYRAQRNDVVLAALPVMVWALAFGLACLGAGLAISASYTAMGVGAATVRRARLRASLIPLDPRTRQYPLLTYEVNGVPRVYNPNTGTLVKMDSERNPVPQMITASGAVQLAGAVAYEAAQARDAAGVAMVNPPLVVEGEVSAGRQRQTSG